MASKNTQEERRPVTHKEECLHTLIAQAKPSYSVKPVNCLLLFILVYIPNISSCSMYNFIELLITTFEQQITIELKHTWAKKICFDMNNKGK